MLEFFYTIFLLRWSSQLFHNTIKSPQSFGGVLKSVAYVLIILYGLGLYNAFAEGNFTKASVTTALTILPFLVVLAGVNIWGGSILEKASQARYDEMHTFKAFGRGFLGIAVVFLFFVSLNIIFGIIFLVCCMFWLVLLIGSLGTLIYAFEKIVYLPVLFFETEAYIFKFLGIDGFLFVAVLGIVVILLPFCISLWAILKRKMLMPATENK